MKPESNHGSNASLESIKRHAVDNEIVDYRFCVHPADVLQHRAQERPARPQIGSASPGRPELAVESGWNNELLAVFAHELRNSLGTIRSATHILRMDASAKACAVKARTLIERQVGQMTHLVEDLLDVSRVRNGQLRLRSERIDLCVLAAHAAEAVEFIMQQRHHRMSTAFPDTPVWLQADPARLEQVLVNLLLNAAKYTDAGGHIGLFVERTDAEAVVRIRDAGIGIARDVLPRVFDLFVQADPSSRRSEAGLGIGLALVRSVVERHGGRVAVTSAGPGHGSEFTIRLPRFGM